MGHARAATGTRPRHVRVLSSEHTQPNDGERIDIQHDVFDENIAANGRWGCTDAALSLYNVIMKSALVEFQNVNPTATRPTTSRPSLSKKVFEAIQFPVREIPLHDCRA